MIICPCFCADTALNFRNPKFMGANGNFFVIQGKPDMYSEMKLQNNWKILTFSFFFFFLRSFFLLFFSSFPSLSVSASEFGPAPSNKGNSFRSFRLFFHFYFPLLFGFFFLFLSPRVIFISLNQFLVYFSFFPSRRRRWRRWCPSARRCLRRGRQDQRHRWLIGCNRCVFWLINAHMRCEGTLGERKRKRKGSEGFFFFFFFFLSSAEGAGRACCWWEMMMVMMKGNEST